MATELERLRADIEHRVAVRRQKLERVFALLDSDEFDGTEEERHYLLNLYLDSEREEDIFEARLHGLLPEKKITKIENVKPAAVKDPRELP